MRDFVDDDLRGAARLELLDADGRVVHAFGAGRGVQATAADMKRAVRFRLLDADGELLLDLPRPTRH